LLVRSGSVLLFIHAIQYIHTESLNLNNNDKGRHEEEEGKSSGMKIRSYNIATAVKIKKYCLD